MPLTLSLLLGSAAVFGAGARVVCHCANRTDPDRPAGTTLPGRHRREEATDDHHRH